MEKNTAATIDEALKDKILKSVMFHLATYDSFDVMKLSDLKKKPQYQLSQADIEYMDKHQRYLDYMKNHDIFSELGSPSEGFEHYIKVPLRPFTFGVDDLIKFRKVAGKKIEKRTRTVSQKLFLFIKKKVYEEYEVEVDDVYYVPVIADDVLELCKNIVKKLIEIGYKDAKASFIEMTYSTIGYRFSRHFYTLASWEAIKENKLNEGRCAFSDKEVTQVGDDLYEVYERGFSGSSGIAFITMQFEACLEKNPNAMQYLHDIHSIAWKYYVEHYGDIDCFR